MGSEREEDLARSLSFLWTLMYYAAAFGIAYLYKTSVQHALLCGMVGLIALDQNLNPDGRVSKYTMLALLGALATIAVLKLAS